MRNVQAILLIFFINDIMIVEIVKFYYHPNENKFCIEKTNFRIEYSIKNPKP